MKNIVILSGAGLSAESGISTFRENDGLWDNYDVEEICSAGCLEWNRVQTIDFYNQRRADIKEKEPNHAHKVIARLKQKYPDKIKVITQNVDDMLERAGCPDILHLHGFLPELACQSCGEIVNIDYEPQDDDVDTCPECNSLMRPNIVFFGEPAPKYQDMHRLLNDCGLFITIGTSGYVIDVSFLTQYADKSILNNLEPSDAIVEDTFDKIYYESATIAIDKIENDIENYISTGNI